MIASAELKSIGGSLSRAFGIHKMHYLPNVCQQTGTGSKNQVARKLYLYTNIYIYIYIYIYYIPISQGYVFGSYNVYLYDTRIFYTYNLDFHLLTSVNANIIIYNTH